jgi:hypothetical protein
LVPVVDDHLQKKSGVSCAGAATDDDLDQIFISLLHLERKHCTW